MVIHGPPKKVSKTAIFPDALFFTLPLELTDVIRHGVQVHTRPKALFHRKSYSKSRNHALEKVLTNEAPSISDSSCAAASCSPANQSLFKATSWCFSDESGSSCTKVRGHRSVVASQMNHVACLRGSAVSPVFHM